MGQSGILFIHPKAVHEIKWHQPPMLEARGIISNMLRSYGAQDPFFPSNRIDWVNRAQAFVPTDTNFICVACAVLGEKTSDAKCCDALGGQLQGCAAHIEEAVQGERDLTRAFARVAPLWDAVLICLWLEKHRSFLHRSVVQNRSPMSTWPQNWGNRSRTTEFACCSCQETMCCSEHLSKTLWCTDPKVSRISFILRLPSLFPNRNSEAPNRKAGHGWIQGMHWPIGLVSFTQAY